MGMHEGDECGEVDCQYPTLGKDCPCGIAPRSIEEIREAKENAKNILMEVFEKYEVNIFDRLRVKNAFDEIKDIMKGSGI